MISRNERLINYTILGVFALVVLVPMMLTLLLALGPEGAGNGTLDFSSLHFGNFVSAWRAADLGRVLLNSVVYSAGTVLVTALLALPAGYAFATIRMFGGTFLFLLLLVGVMVPLTAVIVPLYFDFVHWHLSDTYLGLIIAHSGLSVSFGVFWMRSYFRTIPLSLLDSASIDGASRWYSLWRICVPMGSGAVFCMSLLVFMWTWNDYLLSLIMIQSNSLYPAALALGSFQQKYVTDYTLMAAAAVVVALPIVGIYVIFQRQLIGGILTGAVKG